MGVRLDGRWTSAETVAKQGVNTDEKKTVNDEAV